MGGRFTWFPWNEQILVGATHIADTSDPGKVHPAPDEIEYLLRSLASLFPRARISANDIRHAFAGIRALPFDPKGTGDHASRQHVLHDHEQENVARLISVIGGDLASAVAVARDCARTIGIRSADAKTLEMADGGAARLAAGPVRSRDRRGRQAFTKKQHAASWSGMASVPWRLHAWRTAVLSCARRSARTRNTLSQKPCTRIRTNARSR